MSVTKTLGIVGGMGPEAGLSLYNKVLLHTKAKTDQEHLSAILVSYPGLIQDRTTFLEGTTSINPAYSVVKIISQMEKVGAEVVGIACNTCHVSSIYDVIKSELDALGSKVLLMSMPTEVVNHLKGAVCQGSRIGIMSTNGTYKSKLYENLLRVNGYEVVLPQLEFQESVIHRMIYDPVFGIKACSGFITQEVKFLLAKSIEYFRSHFVKAVILGCTELSLLQLSDTQGILFIDSTEVFAKALVKAAKKI